MENDCKELTSTLNKERAEQNRMKEVLSLLEKLVFCNLSIYFFHLFSGHVFLFGLFYDSLV